MKKTFLLFFLMLYGCLSYGQYNVLEDFHLAASHTENPFRQRLEKKLKQEGKLVIDFYSVSKDIKSIVTQQMVEPFVKAHPDKVILNIIPVDVEGFNKNLTASQKQEGREETLRQLAIQALYPDKYLDYLVKRGHTYLTNDWEEAAKELQMDLGKIKAYSKSSESQKLYKKNNLRVDDTKLNSFLNAAESILIVNGKQFELEVGDVSNLGCCSLFSCMDGCLSEEYFGTDTERIFNIVEGLWILANCAACLVPEPGSTIQCSICVDDFTDEGEGYIVNLIACYESCIESPCSYAASSECPLGSYCHNVNWTQGIFLFEENECVECPRIETAPNMIQLIFSDVYSPPSGTIFETAPPRLQFTLTKNGVPIFSAETNGVDLDFNLNHYSSEPEIGDKYCLEYTDLNFITACPPKIECYTISCPEPSLSVINGQLVAEIDFFGIPTPVEVEVYEEIQVGSGGTVFLLDGTYDGSEGNFRQEFGSVNAGEVYYIEISPLEAPYNASCPSPTSDMLNVELCQTGEQQITFDFEALIIQPESKPGEKNGWIYVEAYTGTTPPTVPIDNLSYTWNTNPSQTGQAATGLGSGFYCVTALNETTNCSATECFFLDYLCSGNEQGGEGGNDGVPNDDPCMKLGFEITPETGPGTNNGSINVIPDYLGSFPSNEFFYYWEDLQGATFPTRENLAPGEYCVTVTTTNLAGECCDVAKCVNVGDYCSTVNIELPEFDITQPVNCDDESGIIDIPTSQITGAVLPYTFLWNNGATTDHIKNVPEGIYAVTLTDKHGCTASKMVKLEAINSLELSTQNTSPNHPDCDGSIQLDIQGGTPPYAINVELLSQTIFSTNGSNLQYTYDGLCAGTYYIEVEDANGCTESIVVELPACQGVFIEEPVITGSESCQSPQGTPVATGSIDFGTETPQTGTPPYTYAWSNGATTLSVDELEVGQYTLTITDANGCTSEYTYMIQNNTSSLTYFTVEVVDIQHDVANDCSGSATVHVTYSGVSSHIHLNLYPSGQAVSIPKFSSIDETYTFEGLCGDDYTLIASTDVGVPPTAYCTIEQNFTIEACPGFEMVNPPTVVHPSDCEASDGSIDYVSFANPNGGTPPYVWSWSNGSTDPLRIDNLPPDYYSLTVTDANGCSIEKTFDLTVPNDPALTEVEILQQPSNDCDGSISISGITGVSVILNYPQGGQQLINLSTGNPTIIEGLCPGTYTYFATQDGRCTYQDKFTLEGCDPMTSLGLVNANPPLVCGESTGFLRFITGPTGGTAPYTYVATHEDGTVFTEPGNNRINDLPSGLYTITVTDALGCTADFELELYTPGIPVLNLYEVFPECEGEANGIIEIIDVYNVGGGQITNTYSIEPMLSTTVIEGDNDNALISGLETGTYEVTITASNGCTASYSFFVDERLSMGPFTLESGPFTEASCPYEGQESGTITFELSGGNKPYSIWLEKGDEDYIEYSNGLPTATTTIVFENMGPGTYTVNYIRDDCDRRYEYNQPIVVEAYEEMFASFNVNVDCPGESDVNLTISGNAPGPYIFAWTGPNGYTATTEDIFDLAEGQYTVMVTDANGCFIEESVFVDVLDPPTVDVTVDIPYACEDYPIGSISVSISGGTDPINFQWTEQSTGTMYNTQDLSCLSPGSYLLEVTDGCDTYVYGPYSIDSQVTDTRAHAFSCFNEIWCGTFQVDFEFGGVEDIQSNIDNSGCPSGACSVTIICENESQITVNGIDSGSGSFTPFGNLPDCSCCEARTCFVNNYSDIALSTTADPCSNQFLEDQQTINININGTYNATTAPSDCPECIDTDGDLIADFMDSCDDEYNPAPIQDPATNDCNGNGDVDICETFDENTDTDGDGIPNTCDNCVNDYNPTQLDTDGDDVGDACDNLHPTNDLDNDGVPDFLNGSQFDNCFFPDNPVQSNNPHQFDCDGDGVGDTCDPDYPCSPNSPPTAIPLIINPGNVSTHHGHETLYNDEKSQIKIYPNPFQNEFTVEYQSETAGKDLTINLYNLNGQLIQQRKEHTVKGMNAIILRIDQQIPNGVYEVEILGEQNSPANFKLIKMN